MSSKPSRSKRTSAFSSRLVGFKAPSSTGTEVSASPTPKKRLCARLSFLSILSNPFDRILHELGICAFELVASDTVIGNPAQVEITTMLTHRSDHGMVLAAAVPVRLQYPTIFSAFNDTTHIDVGSKTGRALCRARVCQNV